MQEVSKRLDELFDQEFGYPLKLEALKKTNWSFLEELGENVSKFVPELMPKVSYRNYDCNAQAICLNTIGKLC